MAVEEYSETKIDKDDLDPPLLFVFGKSINRKLVYIKLKIKGDKNRKRFATIILKGEEVTYEEKFYFCANADEDENEFETGAMTNANLLNARNAYRVNHGLLTSDEIVAIRESGFLWKRISDAAGI